MAETGRAEASGSCTLNGSGAGSFILQPDRAGLWWTITHMTTWGQSTLDPTLDVYRNSVTPFTVVDHSDRANSDVSETSLEIGPGEMLIFNYTAGTPGAVMSGRIEGTYRRGVP